MPRLAKGGKIYDTDLATLVERGVRDGQPWVRRSLYRTQNGAWFFFDQHGRNSILDVFGGFVSWEITPLRPDEARHHLEWKRKIEELLRWFPDDYKPA